MTRERASAVAIKELGVNELKKTSLFARDHGGGGLNHCLRQLKPTF